MEFGGSPPSTSLTEDKFDLIAAESMFGQHLELQHLSEGDSDAINEIDHGNPRGDLAPRDQPRFSIGYDGTLGWDTWVGHWGSDSV